MEAKNLDSHMNLMFIYNLFSQCSIQLSMPKKRVLCCYVLINLIAFKSLNNLNNQISYLLHSSLLSHK